MSAYCFMRPRAAPLAFCVVSPAQRKDIKTKPLLGASTLTPEHNNGIGDEINVSRVRIIPEKKLEIIFVHLAGCMETQLVVVVVVVVGYVSRTVCGG